jgi:hypothetical protein
VGNNPIGLIDPSGEKEHIITADWSGQPGQCPIFCEEEVIEKIKSSWASSTTANVSSTGKSIEPAFSVGRPPHGQKSQPIRKFL